VEEQESGTKAAMHRVWGLGHRSSAKGEGGMKEHEGFVMTADVAMEFYEMCIEKKAETLEERTALLREFVKNKQAQYVRDVKGSIKGKKIGVVKRRKE
jgi:hypothetical protein